MANDPTTQERPVSALDELHALEERVTRRLRELQPLVDEYDELLRVARRLGIDPEAAGRPKASAAPAASKRRGTKAARPGPSSRRNSPSRTAPTDGSRHDQVLGVVREHPGITVPELGRQLGVDPTSLYRVVRRLEQQGHVLKQGRRIQPTAQSA